MIFFEDDRTRSAGELYYCRHFHDLESRLHLHNSFELVCLEEGELLLELGERSYTMYAGQGALVFPNQVHGYRAPTSSVGYVFVFSADLIGEFAQKTQKSHPVCPIFELNASDLGARIAAAATDRYLLKSLLYEMLHQFEQTAAYVPRTAKGTELLGNVLSVIAARYREPITMREIARELGYDHRYLTNLMQKGLHTTFRRLLNAYRISHAQHLLLRTDSPIEQIAGECGYESLCSFNRNFKEITGTTPTACRASGHQRPFF